MRRITAMVLVVMVLCVSSAQAGLIERIMGLPGFKKISVHQFYAINNERIQGRQTRQNVIDVLGLVGDDITDYDALAILAPNGSSTVQEVLKSHFLGSVHSIFLLAETRTPGYDTPAAVRSKLGMP